MTCIKDQGVLINFIKIPCQLKWRGPRPDKVCIIVSFIFNSVLKLILWASFYLLSYGSNEARLRAQGAVSARKALQGSNLRELLGGTEVLRGHRYTLQANQWVFTYLSHERNIWLLAHQRWLLRNVFFICVNDSKNSIFALQATLKSWTTSTNWKLQISQRPTFRTRSLEREKEAPIGPATCTENTTWGKIIFQGLVSLNFFL